MYEYTFDKLAGLWPTWHWTCVRFGVMTGADYGLALYTIATTNTASTTDIPILLQHTDTIRGVDIQVPKLDQIYIDVSRR